MQGGKKGLRHTLGLPQSDGQQGDQGILSGEVEWPKISGGFVPEWMGPPLPGPGGAPRSGVGALGRAEDGGCQIRDETG